jgi:hypothetical protein
MRPHELEDPDGIEPASRANHDPPAGGSSIREAAGVGKTPAGPRLLPGCPAFLAQLSDLTSQPAQLLRLGRAQPIATAAGVALGLLDPVADRLRPCGGLRAAAASPVG